MKPAAANSHLSALITSLPLEFSPALEEIAALGFAYIDLVGAAVRPDAERGGDGIEINCAGANSHTADRARRVKQSNLITP